MRRACALFGVLGGLLVGVPASGQTELVGEVRREGRPLAGADVLLHQVSSDSAGEVGRRVTGADGRFLFAVPELERVDLTEDIFFASVRHDGILYFGNTIGSSTALDSLYVIEVYDTATAPEGVAPIAVPVRNLILEPVDGGWRVTDLIEVRNDAPRTWVGGTAGAPVWRHPLSPSATEASVGQSDLPVGAGRFESGMAITNAAIPPGSRVYMFRYRIPDVQFVLPVIDGTERLEVLVQEPAPALSVLGLAEAPPAELEPGSTFRRFVGSDLAAANVLITPGSEDARIPMAWLIVVMALVLSGVGLWAVVGRGPGGSTHPVSARRTPEPGREDLLRMVAQLDQHYAESDPSPAESQRYARERAALLQRLRKGGGAP